MFHSNRRKADSRRQHGNESKQVRRQGDGASEWDRYSITGKMTIGITFSRGELGLDLLESTGTRINGERKSLPRYMLELGGVREDTGLSVRNWA